jgi:hypothetical protein
MERDDKLLLQKITDCNSEPTLYLHLVEQDAIDQELLIWRKARE